MNSTQAIQMSVFVVRALVELREVLATHKPLAGKLTELDRKVGTQDKASGSAEAHCGKAEPALPYRNNHFPFFGEAEPRRLFPDR